LPERSFGNDLESLRRKRTVTEISQSLSKKLNEPMTEDVIWLALDNFKKDNLLEDNEHFEINFNGLTRRQVIKKIGFASMITLPFVSSVVAPNAAMAASGLAISSAPLLPNASVIIALRTRAALLPELLSDYFYRDIL
jgi:hypothetical protein